MLSTERSYNKQQEQQKQSFTSGAVPRAMRLFDIVWNEIAKPAYTALIQRGLPTEDWNVFWSSPVSGMGSMTLATQSTLALEKMGPTYVKFGQALASRPDVVPRALAQALSTLQDSMQPFDTKVAKAIIQRELESSFANDQDLEVFVSSLSEVPVAAASIGQVYSGRLPNGQKVAIKVQRPGIREIVNQDSSLLRTIVELIESIPAISGIQTDQKRFIETDLSGAVEEFMSRVIEELDYRNEARNLQLFFELYSHRRELTQEEKKNENRIEIVVPEVYMNLCTDSVLVMEWIEGTHLVDLETENSTNESLDLIDMAIQCTFSQLLDTGVMHADPHGGNLLKVLDKKQGKEPILRLGYVDFGLLSTVPVGVRDGLVCAVAELVFSKNVTAVANLFGELDLIPEEILSDHSERIALSKELNTALNSCLVYDGPPGGSATDIPALRFDKLLDALTRYEFYTTLYLVNRFQETKTLI
jgi:predicted unusual protein kinase regulating ubiquinone biosynthesis (AarF/ABC1/UbiB family)